MIVSINQPAYLPWLGYFHRIAISDLHIVLDHVQFEKNSFTNRNKIRTKEGWCWLTVPVMTKGRFGDLSINELEISTTASWERKHWSALCLNYKKSEYFAQHTPVLEEIYSRRWSLLMDLMRGVNDHLLRALNVGTRIILSSELKVQGKGDELILNLCRAVGASVYVSGPLGRNYLREDLFRESGIRVVYHDYNHPTYDQVYSGFEPYMSAVDLLFNYGPASIELLMNNQSAI